MVFTEETAQILTRFIQVREGKTFHDSQDFAYEILDLLVEYGDIDLDSAEDEEDE